MPDDCVRIVLVAMQSLPVASVAAAAPDRGSGSFGP